MADAATLCAPRNSVPVRRKGEPAQDKRIAGSSFDRRIGLIGVAERGESPPAHGTTNARPDAASPLPLEPNLGVADMISIQRLVATFPFIEGASQGGDAFTIFCSHPRRASWSTAEACPKTRRKLYHINSELRLCQTWKKKPQVVALTQIDQPEYRRLADIEQKFNNSNFEVMTISALARTIRVAVDPATKNFGCAAARRLALPLPVYNQKDDPRDFCRTRRANEWRAPVCPRALRGDDVLAALWTVRRFQKIMEHSALMKLAESSVLSDTVAMST